MDITGENPASCGFHLRYGKFDYIAGGDLTSAPQNKMAAYYNDFVGTLEGFKGEGVKKGTVDIRIKRIQLVYCAIQSVGGGYTVVPAWMFCGEMIVDGEPNTGANAYSDDLFDANRFMIINAIDGSRISGVSGNGWGVDMF